MSIVRWPKLLELLGYFSLAVAASMIVPLLLALYFRDDGLVPLLGAIAFSGAIGAILIAAFRGSSIEFTHREAILMVVLTWLAAITGDRSSALHWPGLVSAADRSMEPVTRTVPTPPKTGCSPGN